MRKIDDQSMLRILGYMAPAIFVGAMCWGFLTYTWSHYKGQEPLLESLNNSTNQQQTKTEDKAASQVIDKIAVDVTGDEAVKVVSEAKGDLGNEVEPAAPAEKTDVKEVNDSVIKTNWQAGSFELPIFWNEERRVLRNYGLSFAATYGDYRFHSGMDFVVNQNEEILASAPGVVAQVNYSKGNKYEVVIQHNDQWESRYSHLDSVKITLDEKVGLGQVIGVVNEPGIEEQLEGPHLHWELWHRGIRQNPKDWIANEDFELSIS